MNDNFCLHAMLGSGNLFGLFQVKEDAFRLFRRKLMGFSNIVLCIRTLSLCAGFFVAAEISQAREVQGGERDSSSGAKAQRRDQHA